MRRRFKPRRSFRRFRRGVRPPTENGQQRWERGEIGFQAQIPVSDDFTTFTQVVSLAQISKHTFDTSIVSGRNAVFFENAVRCLEIGGIVMDLGVNQASIDGFLIENNLAFARAGFVLCHDRLDTSGIPNAISPTWGQANVPMVDPSGLSVSDEDTDFPSRVLLRRATVVDWSSSITTSVANVHDHGFLTRQWHVNRRLKLALPDSSGLFLHLYWAHNGLFPAEFAPVLNYWMVGSIYYRFKL